MTERGDSADRISEAFKGELWSERATRIARERVFWMCRQVKGSRVLDVGCSQGIVSILLAREGFSVLGIDSVPGVVEYANADLTKETDEVRSRVEFRQIELQALDKEQRFDTIVLGEIIEHQADPLRFIRQTLEYLDVGGRLIVTTPFGYAPHEDHKISLFPSFFAKLREDPLAILSLEVEAGTIRCVLERTNDGEGRVPTNTRLLRVTESATLNSQRRLNGIVLAERERAASQKSAVDLEALEDSELVSGATVRNTSLDSDRLVRFLIKEQKKLQALEQRNSELENSVSLRVGREIGSALKSPSKLLKLPITLRRSVSLARSSRGSDVPSRRMKLQRSELMLALMKKPVDVVADVVADQHYAIDLDLFSPDGPVSKGLILEVISENIDQLLQLNPWLKKRKSSGQAFYYLDLDKAGRWHAVLRTTPRCKKVVFRLEPFRSASIGCVAIVHPLKLVSGLDAIASPTGGRARNPNLPVVASILDEFSHDCLDPVANLIPVTKSNWHNELKGEDLDLLFVESAWRGNEGSWNYALTKPGKWGVELKALIDYCRERNVPTVFWNKEDPVNFDSFIESAALFDYVFTTDDQSVANYKARLGHERVSVLPFAAQPSLHNPVRTSPKENRVAFTGSWRGIKYPKRAAWIDMLLTPLARRDVLDIFDRYADETDNPDLMFPEPLRSKVVGSLPYTQLVEQVYRKYATFVSVNSVEDSNTMLARRVFEMLACGGTVISSPSPAIESTFGDVVFTPGSDEEVGRLVDDLMADALFRDAQATKGIRAVHGEHTYKDRMASVCEAVGAPYVIRKHRRVTVICVSKRPDFLRQISGYILGQSHKELELIFVQHGSQFDEREVVSAFSELSQFQLLTIDEDSVLADGLNLAAATASGDVLAKFDDDDHYGPDYLRDALLAFGYLDRVGVVGKQAFFAYLEEGDRTVLRFSGQSYRYAPRVHGGTLVWDPNIVGDIKFPQVRRGTDSGFLEQCRNNGVPIFSIDPFNFVHVRHADKGMHTWKIDDEEFLAKSEDIAEGLAVSRVFV